MSQSVNNKQIKNYSWSFFDGITNAVLTAISAIVLARMLSPEDFGLIGMLAIFIAISNGVVNSGFFISLIRKANSTENDFNTVFVFNLVASLIIYVVLLLLSPLVGEFYNKQELSKILPILSIIVIVNSLSIVHLAQITKRVDYKSLFICTITSSLISLFISIYLALNNFGVWSLVAQQLSKQLINTLMLWIVNPWRPKISFSKESFRELFSYGSIMFIAGTLNTITKSSYQSILGKFSTTSNVGYFNRADQFSTLISSNLVSIINRVSFPTLAKYQDNEGEFNKYYFEVLKYSTIIVSFFMILLALNSNPIILLLIGEKWKPAIIIMKILCVNGIVFSVNTVVQSHVQIKGFTKLFLKIELLRMFLTIPLMIFALKINLNLALYSILFVNVLITVIFILINDKRFKVSFRRQLSYSFFYAFCNLPLFVLGNYFETIIQNLYLQILSITSVFLLYNLIVIKYVFDINLSASLKKRNI